MNAITAARQTGEARRRIDPKFLLALAGLLIGLGSGYWSREMISQSYQESCFAEVREDITKTKIGLVALDAKMLEMRLSMNSEIDSRIRRTTDGYRSDTLRLEEKIDAIGEQIVGLKLQINRLETKYSPP